METYFHFLGNFRGSSEIWMVLRGVEVCGVGEVMCECIVYYMYNRGIVKEIPRTGKL